MGTLLNDILIKSYETRVSQLLNDGFISLATTRDFDQPGATNKMAQSFTVSTPYDLAAVEFLLRKLNGPEGFCLVNIYSDNGGVPGTILASSFQYNIEDIDHSLTGAPKVFVLTSPYPLQPGFKYHAVFEYAFPGGAVSGSNIDGSNNVRGFCKTSDVLSGGNLATYINGVWTPATKDAVFRIFSNINANAYDNINWLPAPAGVTVAPTVLLSKLGKMVTMVFPSIAKTDGNGVTIAAAVGIPVGYRPAAAGGNLQIPIMVSVNAVPAVGYVAIGTSGSFEIFASAAGDTFTDNVAATVSGFSVTYFID